MLHRPCSGAPKITGPAMLLANPAAHTRPKVLPCPLTLTQALAAYAGALAARPAYVPALLGCASIYKEGGQLADALRMLERAAALTEHSSEVAGALAVVLTDLGELLSLDFLIIAS